MLLVVFFTALVACSSALQTADSNAPGPCNFDGHQYQAGETIMIARCLATMKCLGDNNYGEMTSLGGICPDTREAVDGQTGCLFDGSVYGAGEKVVIPSCLGEMTCLGHNNYSPITSYGGICPSKRAAVDGQTGCLFDGRVYAPGETIYVACLAKLTCLGHNELSAPISLGGQC